MQQIFPEPRRFSQVKSSLSSTESAFLIHWIDKILYHALHAQIKIKNINNLHFLYLADYLSLWEISLNCSKVICKDPKHHCKILALSNL